MTSNANGFIPISQQEAIIGADLNSTLLYQFLFGIYTGVFPVTLYIYCHKENRTPSRDRIIIGTIAALYGVTFLNMVLDWYYTNVVFVTQGTRFEILIESAEGTLPVGVALVFDLLEYIGYIFADALLVWRCFHACGQSFRRTMLPFVLLALEIVLAVFMTIFKCLTDAKPDFDTYQHGQDSNYLVAATFISVAATSLVSTLFICREIYKHTMPGSSSRKHHRTIIILLIESAATYSAAVLFLAVVNGIVTGSSQSAFISYIISNYGSAVAQIVSGMAPTIMIARLSLSSSHKPIEVSSATARLPSDVVNYAPNPLERENGWADLEMQQGDFQQPVDEEGAESIVVVSRSSNSARYQPQVCIEDRAYSSVYADTADGKNRSSLVA